MPASLSKLSRGSLIRELFWYGLIFFLPISNAAVEICFIFILVLSVSECFIHKRRPDLPRFVSAAAGFHLLFCLISLISPFRDLGLPLPVLLDTGLSGFFKWFQFWALFILAYDFFQEPEHRRRALLVFMSSMVLVTANGLFQLWNGADFLRGFTIEPGRIRRMKSSLGAPNLLASFYLFAIPITLWAWHKQGFRDTKAVPVMLIFFFFVAGFFLTFSRGAFIALLFAILSLIFIKAGRQRLLFVGGLIFLAGALMLNPTLRKNYVESLTFNNETVAERIQFWQTGGAMIQSHPFTGIGVNFYHHRTPEFSPEGKPAYAHNSHLQIGAEIGIFGWLVFFLFLVMILRKPFGPKEGLDLSHLLWMACLAFILQSFVDNNFIAMQTALLFAVWAGLGEVFRQEITANCLYL